MATSSQRPYITISIFCSTLRRGSSHSASKQNNKRDRIFKQARTGADRGERIRYLALETRRKLGRVNFRRLLRLLLGTGKKNWPIADRRVPSNDTRNNCGTYFSSSSPLVSEVANGKESLETSPPSVLWASSKGASAKEGTICTSPSTKLVALTQAILNPFTASFSCHGSPLKNIAQLVFSCQSGYGKGIRWQTFELGFKSCGWNGQLDDRKAVIRYCRVAFKAGHILERILYKEK